jgi:hypothetical protein
MLGIKKKSPCWPLEEKIIPIIKIRNMIAKIITIDLNFWSRLVIL